MRLNSIDPKVIKQYKKIAQELIDKEKKGLIQIEGATPNKIPINLLDMESQERRNVTQNCGRSFHFDYFFGPLFYGYGFTKNTKQ